MARPIKVLAASKEVRAELRRRANGRSTEHRDRFWAETGADALDRANHTAVTALNAERTVDPLVKQRISA